MMTIEDIDDIVKEYDLHLFRTYADFSQELEHLLRRLLTQGKINHIDVYHRTKDVESFRSKIIRKSYTDPLSEVTDLSGARIVVRRTSDVMKVVEMITGEFVVDDEHSVYKAEELDVNEFGYLSVHLVVTLNQGRSDFGEYKDFQGLKAEIQIRTILQHAWADVSHSLDYKLDPNSPYELRRRLFRLSALLELGDQEIDLLVQYVQQRRTYYAEKFTRGEREIEVNVDSLQAYVETAEEARDWVNRGGRISGQQISTCNHLSTTVSLIEYFGLKSFEDIKRVLIGARTWGEEFLAEVFDDLAKRYDYQIDKMEVTQNGLVQSLVIGSMADRLPAETLEREFGLPRTGIIEIALRCRGISPVTKRPASRAGRASVKRRGR